MAGLFERMGLVRTEYEGMPEIPMQPVSEPMYAPETPVIDATQVSYDDVIASIYQQSCALRGGALSPPRGTNIIKEWSIWM